MQSSSIALKRLPGKKLDKPIMVNDVIVKLTKSSIVDKKEKKDGLLKKIGNAFKKVFVVDKEPKDLAVPINTAESIVSGRPGGKVTFNWLF
jgi:hypothetical protein